MTLRKVVAGGIFLVLIIEFVSGIGMKKVKGELSYYQSSVRKLNERKIQLDQMRSFLKENRLDLSQVSLFVGNAEWAKAYSYDLLRGLVEERGISATMEVEEPQESPFFPSILHIKEITFRLGVEDPIDFFDFLELIRGLKEDRFFIDSLSMSAESEATEGVLSLSLKYFYMEEYVE